MAYQLVTAQEGGGVAWLVPRAHGTPTMRGMEPDDLLCSRNARPQKALVGRAQWKINQPPSLKREQAIPKGSIRMGWWSLGKWSRSNATGVGWVRR